MAICTGKGGDDRTHCCWVDGEPCPLLIQITPTDVIRGGVVTPIDTWIASQQGKPKKDIAAMLATEPRWLCGAATDVLLDDPNILDPTKRQAFNTRWGNHAEYGPIGAWWASIGVTDCWDWNGTVEGFPSCCFAQSPEDNAADASNMPLIWRQFQASSAGASDPGGQGSGGGGGGGQPKSGPMTQVRDLG